MHNLLQTWVDEGRPTRSSHSWSSTSWSSRSSERYSRRICESSKARRRTEESQTKSRTVILRSSISTLQSRAAAPARPRHRPAQRGEYCGFSDVGSQRTLLDQYAESSRGIARSSPEVHPTDGGRDGARYRFATQEERIIYDDTEANEDDPDWDAVLHALDEHLWGRITQDLSLPESVPYGDSGDEYPVMYGFGLDGTGFETTVDVEGGLDVPIEVQGVRPDHTSENSDEETLYWSIDTDGLDDLRKHLVKWWWALRDAISTHNAPTAVEQDLDRRADAVRSKLVSAMQSGSYTVKDRTDISGLSTAVQTAVDVGYPDDFHPMMMLQVTDDRLQELVELSTEDPLPAWAHTIQVPSSDPSASQGKKSIQRNVMSLTGRQLKDRDDGLNMNTVLDGITSKKPFYDEARPALCAIIWGFCRRAV